MTSLWSSLRDLHMTSRLLLIWRTVSLRLSMQVNIIWYLVGTYASVLILTIDHDQFFPGCLGLVQRALSAEPLHKPQASRGLPTWYFSWKRQLLSWFELYHSELWWCTVHYDLQYVVLITDQCSMQICCAICVHKHQAWADTEGGLIRACAAYCLDRFQRYDKSRLGLQWYINPSCFRFHMDNITYSVLCAMLSLFWFLLPTPVGPSIFCSWFRLYYIIKINVRPYICMHNIITYHKIILHLKYISIWNGQQIPAPGQDTSAWTWSGLSSRLSWRTLQSGEMGSRYAWHQPIDLHVQRSSYTDPFFGFRIWLEKKH